MSVTVTPEPEDYGFVSNSWLLRLALGHVPHKSLYQGVVALIHYLVVAPEVDRLEALDILTQVSLTGGYIQVINPGHYAEKGEVTGTFGAPEDVEDPITEEEAERFAEDLKAFGDDAKDPFEGWTLK